MSIDHTALAEPEPLRQLQSGMGDIGNGDDLVTIENRFGRFVFDRDHALSAPRGLPGFPEATEFGLASLPDPRYQNFRLFQCLADPDLSFIVAPLDPKSGLISGKDVAEMLDSLDIPPNDAAMLLVVTARKDPEQGVSVSVNLRAPIVVDARKRTAHQHVLPSDAYAIRHPVALVAA